ncbi:MAG: organomercurial lyase MerB [Chloroflexi bacterium]|nr:organomercurial lyase MerB [Chloroflexota bacterium]
MTTTPSLPTLSRAEDHEALAGAIAAAIRSTSGEDAARLVPKLIDLLAAGRPVRPETLAAEAGYPLGVVAEALERFGAETDETGAIVGAGLSLVPTQHRVLLDGRLFYAWCALDTLFFPVVLNRTFRVESPCATTRMPVRLTVTPDGIAALEPATAAVSLVAGETGGQVRYSFCDYVHFFTSLDTAAQWLAAHPGAIAIPVADAFEVGRLLAQTYR